MKPPLAQPGFDWNDLEADARDTLAGHQTVLGPIFSHAPYLVTLTERHPQVALRCLEGRAQEAFDAAIGEEPAVAKRLRLAKQRVALVCALADLTDRWSTMEVTARLATFADAALEIALAEAMRIAASRGKLVAGTSSGFGIVAMGKHGANELNYSSDIDVIVLFDPDDAVFPDRMDALDAAVRVTRDVVRLMQERDVDGYVFRTDLRLRPDPGSMPLAISLAMAESYYETRGQNWERAAWIKARHAAGDRAVTDRAFAMLRPFIWRRYLDFAAIADIHSIKRQIQAHRDILDLSVPGHNVKLGRGGIREIEFFVQTQQLIAGGRDERLRGRGTVETLTVLADLGWIDPHVAEELTESYLLLRDVEHRLQMIDDRQTHTLPETADELAAFARFCGEADPAAFEAELRRHLVRTEVHYASLFADEPDLAFDEGNLSFTGDDPDPDTLATFDRLGFARPADMVSIVKGWHYGRSAALRSASARERLTELVPLLLQGFSRRDDPDRALLSFDAFLSGLPAGVQLFALLDANPSLTSLLLDVLADAPRMARLVQHRPHVLDAVVEPRFFADLPSADDLATLLEGALAQARDYEAVLDAARSFAAEQRLLISLRLMGGAIGVQRAGVAYTVLAETILAKLLDHVRADFAERHGTVPGSRIAIIGMGRLGSRELTANSDLDLVFVTDRADANAMSDGERSLAAGQYDMRLVQKLIAAISAPTGQGRIYELDFRLRPSGNSGPLATTLRAFREHQQERAKVWEHLALTRARPVAGDPDLCKEIDDVIETTLSATRDRSQVTAEVREMRELMDEERPGSGDLEVKLSPGGLIDLEFIAQQALLLGDAPIEVRPAGPAAVLETIGARELSDAYHLFSTVQHLTRLGLENDDDPMPSGLLARIVRAVDEPDAARLVARLEEAKAAVRAAFLQRTA